MIKILLAAAIMVFPVAAGAQQVSQCAANEWCIHVMFQRRNLTYGDHFAPQATEAQCKERAAELADKARERNALVPGGGQVLNVECVLGQ
jgi:hypothetical protein